MQRPHIVKHWKKKKNQLPAYNLGNTIYNQNRIPEAIQQYQKSIESTDDPALKSNAWYNLGNAHYQNKEFDKSIEAYKESLKLQPADEDAKKNLMLAMRQYQQQQQQQQQENEDQNKDQQQQDNKNEQEQKENRMTSRSRKMNHHPLKISHRLERSNNQAKKM